MLSNIATTGVPSPEELAACPGIPSQERMKKGRVAVIECIQEIPCNPCEYACPSGAITVGEQITSLPILDSDKCTGCGQCIPCCPGLAIFIVDKSRTDGFGEVAFPYEYLPLPVKGDTVTATDRAGQDVCSAGVLGVRQNSTFHGTVVVNLLIPAEYVDVVRGIRTDATPTKTMQSDSRRKTTGQSENSRTRIGHTDLPSPGTAADNTDDSLIICRCREVTRGEILAAIDDGADTVDGIKRRTTACMGLCQGKSCERLIINMIAEHTKQDAATVLPQKSRMPVRPVKISTAGGTGHA